MQVLDFTLGENLTVPYTLFNNPIVGLSVVFRASGLSISIATNSMVMRRPLVCMLMNGVLQIRQVSFHALRAIGRAQCIDEWNAMP
jgi:hypothetical protein